MNKTNTQRQNDLNQADYGSKTNGDYRRQLDKNLIHDYIETTDWSKESLYHNSVRVNGKNNIGRTIKMNNKDWHKLNKTLTK